MIKEAIHKVFKKENLTYKEAEAVMNEIMEGKASAVQMSSYLTALSMKGETVEGNHRFRGRYARALCSSPARYGCPGDCGNWRGWCQFL